MLLLVIETDLYQGARVCSPAVWKNFTTAGVDMPAIGSDLVGAAGGSKWPR